MELQHIKIENLKPTNINVRKKGAKDIDDLLPSIRSLGVLQPLLVRPKTHSADCEGYEIIAGQRRYHALVKLAEEGDIEAVPCIIMEEGDNAKAIEASLAENIARLPMDEIDQYKAFAALIKEGKNVADIASQFGITERLVQQRLAIANLISPILTLYRNEEIFSDTVRKLTMASKSQQKAWLALFNSEDEHAPHGNALKNWLFGGANILVQNALFDLADYKGSIVSDLFGEDSYFSDSEKFWSLQNTVIAEAKERYLANGWNAVVILEVGEFWQNWEHSETTKKNGGRIYVQIARNGEVNFHEGYLTEKEAKRQKKMPNSKEVTKPAERPELTKVMQNYLDLHRHTAVRTELLGHGGIALRLAVAQIIAGSELWTIKADSQKADNEAISRSLPTNKAEDKFAEQRRIVRDLLGFGKSNDATLVHRKDDWGKSHDLYKVFAKLIALSDEEVTTILTFVVAEALPAGSAMVEVLGNILCVDMADRWSPDEVFLDLYRDKEAINAMLKDIGGKRVADGNVTATAKVQKKIISDFLDGTREGAKADWQPRYMEFPMRTYTKRGGIDAVDNWKAVKKLFV